MSRVVQEELHSVRRNPFLSAGFGRFGREVAVVTVHDVARAAGVSISTVSRALAAPERVADGTRARVVGAARELGYRPNRAASGLRAGRTGAIGFVVPDLENPYFASVTKGSQTRARTAGHAVLVADTGEDVDLEVELIRSLAEQADGLILCSPRALDSDLDVVGAKPVVLVNGERGRCPAVTADDASGMLQAVLHLRALGHRLIAYIGGPEMSWSDRQRRAGLDGLVASVPDVEIIQLGAFRPHVAGGRSAADLVMASGATGVIAYNDLVAIGLIHRVRERGLDIPRDLSVVGCDDTFVATLAAPALTTVGTDLRRVGSTATDVLLDLVLKPGTRDRGRAQEQGQADSARARLPVELVVRESTGVAKVM